MMRPILLACLMILAIAPQGLAQVLPFTASKTFSPSTVTPGATTRITINVTNPNAGAVQIDTVIDTLPGAIVLANPVNASFSAGCPANAGVNNPGDAVFTYSTFSFLGAGATCTIAFDVVAPAGAGKFTNTAIVTPEDPAFTPVPQPSAILCVAVPGNRGQQTVDRIKTFMHRRADLLLEEEPDRNRLLRRLAVSDSDQTTGAGLDAGLTTPFNMRVSGEDRARKLSFSTSLKQLAHASSAKMARAMALGPEGSFKPAAVLPRDGVDIWVEGHYTHFEDDIGGGDRDGHLGVLYVGADHVIRPWLLIGALAQFDWAEDESTRLGSDVTGTGWMAGPYITARLHKNVFFDARGAWGETDNDIDIVGVTKDKFDTQRWLAVARLTGDWWRGAFRVTPSASVKYIEDEQESFTNALGTFIPGQTVSLGRLKFGPEFGYRYDAVDGTRIEPHISIEGIWDFDEAGPLAIGGIVTSANDVRAKVEGGVMLTRPGGVGVRATGAYDGIGDGDFSAYSGKLWVNMPLN